MKQKIYKSVLNIFYDKILKNLSAGRFYLIFIRSIEVDRNINDLFTGSKSVSYLLYKIINNVS